MPPPASIRVTRLVSTPKPASLIVANDISASDAGFGVDTNRVTLIDAGGGIETLPLLSKALVAEAVLERVEQLLARQTW